MSVILQNKLEKFIEAESPINIEEDLGDIMKGIRDILPMPLSIYSAIVNPDVWYINGIIDIDGIDYQLLITSNNIVEINCLSDGYL